jgi:hypothetical protein
MALARLIKKSVEDLDSVRIRPMIEELSFEVTNCNLKRRIGTQVRR